MWHQGFFERMREHGFVATDISKDPAVRAAILSHDPTADDDGYMAQYFVRGPIAVTRLEMRSSSGSRARL